MWTPTAGMFFFQEGTAKPQRTEWASISFCGNRICGSAGSRPAGCRMEPTRDFPFRPGLILFNASALLPFGNVGISCVGPAFSWRIGRRAGERRVEQGIFCSGCHATAMILPRCGHGGTVMLFHQGARRVFPTVGETRERPMVVKKRIPS